MELTSLNSVNLNVSFVSKFSLIANKALKITIAFLITQNTRKKAKHFLKDSRSFSKSTLKLMNLRNSDRSLNETSSSLAIAEENKPQKKLKKPCAKKISEIVIGKEAIRKRAGSMVDWLKAL